MTSNLDDFQFRVWRAGLKLDSDNYRPGYLHFGLTELDGSYLIHHSAYIDGKESVVERWTGLKDLDDKMIFEGDKIRNRFGVVRTVSWNAGQCCFYLWTDKDDNDGEIWCDRPLTADEAKLSRVVGSVLESKELKGKV